MSLPKRLRFRIMERDGFTCMYCGRKPPTVKLEVDHIHPRCQGGDDDPANLRTACYDCNRGKAGVPLAATASKVWTFYAGPLSGQKVELPHQHAAFWVVRNDFGELYTVRDEWTTDPDGERRNVLLCGHPGFGIASTRYHDRDCYHDDRTAGLNPKVLGIYHIEDLYVGGISEADRRLSFWDLDRLVLELTA